MKRVTARSVFRPRILVWVAVAASVGLTIGLTFAVTGSSASSTRSHINSYRTAVVKTQTPDVYNGVNQTDLAQCIAAGENCLATVPGLAQCMQARLNCNDGSAEVVPEVAESALPASGGGQLTESQAIAELGWPAASVAGELVTYGQLKVMMPSLAASDVVNSQREFWALTLYETQTLPASEGFEPPTGGSSTGSKTFTTESALVDASSGVITDVCFGCAMVAQSATP